MHALSQGLSRWLATFLGEDGCRCVPPHDFRRSSSAGTLCNLRKRFQTADSAWISGLISSIFLFPVPRDGYIARKTICSITKKTLLTHFRKKSLIFTKSIRVSIQRFFFFFFFFGGISDTLTASIWLADRRQCCERRRSGQQQEHGKQMCLATEGGICTDILSLLCSNTPLFPGYTNLRENINFRLKVPLKTAQPAFFFYLFVLFLRAWNLLTCTIRVEVG